MQSQESNVTKCNKKTIKTKCQIHTTKDKNSTRVIQDQNQAPYSSNLKI